jgi:transcriptional regulator with XRE-family HTH domain
MTTIGSVTRAAIFAEEDFVVELQTSLHRMMEEKGMTRADLARAMGVTRARVTQIFSDECTNFTVRLLARAYHALGETPEIRRKPKNKEKNGPGQGSLWAGALFTPEDLVRVWDIKEMFGDIQSLIPCNDDTPACLVDHPYSHMEWEAA